MIHNVIRRNLLACSENATSVKSSNVDAFITYANYTLFVLEDQLQSADTVWFPAFAKHDDHFREQIAAHEPLYSKIDELKVLLSSKGKTRNSESLPTEEIAKVFHELHGLTNHQYDVEEALVNTLGHRVPIEEMRELDKKQEARKEAVVKTHGNLWSGVYLLKSLNPKERAIFPPGLPKVIASGMMTGGGLQYRKELHWAPKF
jgi:hypothetical protein